MMLILLLKVTLLLAIPLAVLPLMGRTSSALRHLVCAIALAGTLLLPLSLAIGSHGIAVPIPVIFRASVLAGATARATGGGATLTLFALWGAGLVVLLTRIAVGYWQVSRVVRDAIPGDGYSTADVCVPLVAGLLRPVILMPHSAQCWPLEQRIAALWHERAHIRRKDLWTSLMAHLACAVYWFHPLAWAVARQMRHEQETACDDAVIHSGFEPAIYAEALVATAHQFTSTSLIGCHMLTQKTLPSRIARLLDSRVSRTSSTAALGRTAVVLVLALAAIALLNAQVEEAYQSKVAQSAASAIVFRAGNGVTAPRVITRADPEYTEDARAAKISGTVMLHVVVGTDGVAHDINVVKGLDAGLDVKAVEAVQKWRFEPGTLNGSPVAVVATIEINFKLL
jgi:TonB family protein